MRSTFEYCKIVLRAFVPAAEIRRVMLALHTKKLSKWGGTMTMSDHVARHEATEVIIVAKWQCGMPWVGQETIV
jgi:hypothetical protein